MTGHVQSASVYPVQHRQQQSERTYRAYHHRERMP
jgi:hypothetical protein